VCTEVSAFQPQHHPVPNRVALQERIGSNELGQLSKSLAINTDVGFHHYYGGRYAEAIAQLQSVLGMKGDFGLALLWLARTYLEIGRADEALAAAKAAEVTAPQWVVFIAQRGYTLGAMGRADEAREVLNEMARRSTQRFVTAYGVALVYAGLGVRLARQGVRRAIALADVAAPRLPLEDAARRPPLCRAPRADEVPWLTRCGLRSGAGAHSAGVPAFATPGCAGPDAGSSQPV